MKGYKGPLEQITKKNKDFLRVLYTTKKSQLTVMSIPAKEEIGEETHKVDQFLRFETGKGKIVIGGVSHAVKDGDAVIVPAGTKHNVINISPDKPLKLYAVYSPPEHKDGVVQRTKEEAENSDEHFDGKTSK